MGLRVVGLCAVLAGCVAQPALPEQPGQPEATALVWQQVFGATLAPPPVEWREDTCPGREQGPAAVVYGGACYAGLYLPDGTALVAWRGTFSASAFAHELMHAWQYVRGIEDADHDREEWELVKEANGLLADAGY